MQDLCGVKSADDVARQRFRCPTPHNSALHITHATPSGLSEPQSGLVCWKLCCAERFSAWFRKCFPQLRSPSPRQRGGAVPRLGRALAQAAGRTANRGWAVARLLAWSARRNTSCTLAEPPNAALLHRSASVHFVTSTNRSDCYRLERTTCRAGLPPAGVRCLSTAHEVMSSGVRWCNGLVSVMPASCIQEARCKKSVPSGFSALACPRARIAEPLETPRADWGSRFAGQRGVAAEDSIRATVPSVTRWSVSAHLRFQHKRKLARRTAECIPSTIRPPQWHRRARHHVVTAPLAGTSKQFRRLARPCPRPGRDRSLFATSDL